MMLVEEVFMPIDEKMNVPSLLKSMDLYYSLVENIGYFPESKQLILTINYCNWRQLNFTEDQAENIIGNLTFYEVENFAIEPSSFVPVGNEILNINHEMETNEMSRLELILNQKAGDPVVIVSFLSKEVGWEPLWEVNGYQGLNWNCE